MSDSSGTGILRRRGGRASAGPVEHGGRGADVVDHDRRTLGGVCESMRAPDPAPGADHDDDPAFAAPYAAVPGEGR